MGSGGSDRCHHTVSTPCSPHTPCTAEPPVAAEGATLKSDLKNQCFNLFQPEGAATGAQAGQLVGGVCGWEGTVYSSECAI